MCNLFRIIFVMLMNNSMKESSGTIIRETITASYSRRVYKPILAFNTYGIYIELKWMYKEMYKEFIRKRKEIVISISFFTFP